VRVRLSVRGRGRSGCRRRARRGGCPFSPRATGNVATEDLVCLLEREGIPTGIDVDALVAISQWLEGLLGRTLEGYVYRASTWPPA
jgi:hydroxymethylglutaryl-CoA lyase/(R)-citramalyl-CoA lyase